MAFDLKRVVKVLLFASNGPLSAKDVQTAITRFHEQAGSLPLAEAAETDAAGDPGAPAAFVLAPPADDPK
jgi:segregation and condensation protein B